MANILSAYHGEKREESKKGEYQHFFNENSSSMQQWVIIND